MNGAPEPFHFQKRAIVGWDRIHLVQFRHLGERTSEHVALLLPFVVRKNHPGRLTDPLASLIGQTVLSLERTWIF